MVVSNISSIRPVVWDRIYSKELCVKIFSKCLFQFDMNSIQFCLHYVYIYIYILNYIPMRSVYYFSVSHKKPNIIQSNHTNKKNLV